MSNKTLFQEAIADAKAVREAALANAKAALEESMTPRLQSMISARLEENYDELEEKELWKDEDFISDNGRRQYIDAHAMSEKKLNATDTFYTDENAPEDEYGTEQGYSKTYLGKKVAKNEPGTSDPYIDEELDLSEILAELEAESQLEEAKKKGKEEDEETEDEEAETEEAPEEGDEEEAEPTKVKDMTDEELIDLIKSVVQQEIEAEEEEKPSDEAGEPEHGGMEPMGTESGKEEDIDINELLAELDEMYSNDKEDESMQYEAKKSKHERGETKAQEKEEHTSGKEKKEKSEMKEAISVINTLRSELNEVNLLNAKLLYVNKIFKAKSLTESQKVHVIASFDKATTIKEAKIVFESLNTALSAPKKSLKESLGFASRAAGIAPRQQQIVESNDAITRMQKLANIIK